PPLTAEAGTTSSRPDTHASAPSPRSLASTREAPTGSGLTPRSDGCAFEPARLADRATRENNKRRNGRRATPRPRPTRLGVTEMNAKATPGAGPRRIGAEVEAKPAASGTRLIGGHLIAAISTSIRAIL